MNVFFAIRFSVRRTKHTYTYSSYDVYKDNKLIIKVINIDRIHKVLKQDAYTYIYI